MRHRWNRGQLRHLAPTVSVGITMSARGYQKPFSREERRDDK